MEHLGGPEFVGGQVPSTQRISAPVQLGQPQIPRDLNWD